MSRQQAPVLAHDANDPHGYKMHGALDPGDVDQYGNRYADEASHNQKMDKLAAELAKSQKVTINGVEHYLAWYGTPDRYGARPARLRPVDSPF